MLKLPSLPSGSPNDNPEALAELRAIFINSLESQIGWRDRQWGLLQTEFDDKNPYIFVYKPQNLVKICLSRAAKEDWCAAIHELAHECVHVMNPINHAASFLEEGVAVWFSMKMAELAGTPLCALLDHLDKTPIYRAAYDLVLKLPDEPLCAAKKVRSECGSLSAVTGDALSRIYPSLYMETIGKLCSRCQ